MVVVDNSDDLSACEGIANFDLASNVTLVESHPPGLSRARNRAVELCETRYIAFLDDDAIPSPPWLNTIVEAFRNQPEAVVVAGPIVPIWPAARPEWLPLRYESCLTILDYGPNDHWLGNNEYAWGANISFDLKPLREAGGFNNGLGRVGARILLSGEELQIQNALRARGHRFWYASRAEVAHQVSENRLRRNWFRSRMAWQSVSEHMEEPAQVHLDWARNEITRIGKVLGLEDGLHRLFANKNADGFAAQLDVIRHLVTLLLSAKELPDEELEALFPLPEIRVTMDNKIHNKNKIDYKDEAQVNHVDVYEVTDVYQPSPAIAQSTAHIFVEALPGHGYLYDLYGKLPGTQLIGLPTNPWVTLSTGTLQYVSRSITPNVRTLVFLTIDPFIYLDSHARKIYDLLHEVRIPAFGILHRIPKEAEQVERLRNLSRQLRGVIGLSEAFYQQMREVLELPNAILLPHHPSKFGFYSLGQWDRVRKSMGIRPSQVVFSMLGEMRAGKGVDWLLSALDHIPMSDRHGMFFLLAGKATDTVARAVHKRLSEQQFHGRVDLRSTDHPFQYAVLTSREYADFVAATDIGLLLYQEDQRVCSSGLLSDYVWNRKSVITTADSLVGKEVRTHGLGQVIDEEAPEVLARHLVEAAPRYRETTQVDSTYETYRAAIAPEFVLKTLDTILNSKCERLDGI